MDSELKQTQIRNLILKTKIVLIFFMAVFIAQLSGLIYLNSLSNFSHISLFEFFLIPSFILVVLIDETLIYRYLKKTLTGKRKFSDRWKYFVTVLEMSYPSILMYFGSLIVTENNIDLSNFMFLNAPPYVVYFIFIILSAFYFDFKISLFSGLFSALGYVLISYLLFKPESIAFYVNLSKAPFMIIAGVMAGIVGMKLKSSIISSLESKNILIHELDNKVAARTETIEKQKTELASQYQLLKEHSQEIKDSITYAKRIQTALLPSESYFRQNFPDSFVLYKPKDIVAGDFYWLESLNDTVIFAAADCTGHGVPGAMVSVLCNNGLNRAVREFGLSDPGAILNKTRELVIAEFQKSKEQVRDGMDIALCTIEKDHSGELISLKYAGAHNPLWIIRKGEQEVEEIKGDKQPIGNYSDQKPFQTHEIKLQKGDTVYVFSDGFSDQFGGAREKKFKAKNFKKLLLSVQNEPMERQVALIDEAFENWRGQLEQLDDVCVIGVRF